MMKVSVSFILVLLIAGIHSESLQLYTVSSSPTQVIPPSGSVKGGTTLYIRGLGFSTNANQNQILVGSYPCVIPADGATATTLACVTSDTGSTSNIYYLPITVIANGQQQQLTNQQGSFSYLYSSTPVVLSLYPASAVPGTYVNFYGIHRISDLGDGLRFLGDVIGMYIGDSQCSRFDILQGPISANSGATISCYQAKIQQAGKYQIKEYVVPGYSVPGYLLRRSSFLVQNYHFAVLPGISAISPNSGAEFGQRLTITGSGFSTDSSLVSVTVDGNPCSVVSTSMSQIVCNLKERDSQLTAILDTNSSSQVGGYFSGVGLKYQRYDITNLGTKTPEGLRNAIQSSSASITLVESGYRGEIKTGDYYGSYYGEAFTGYFTAPSDGVYTFQGVADDSFSVYLQDEIYGSAEAGKPLIYSISYQNENFYLAYTSSAENSVTLSAGKSYYIEVYHINLGGSGFLRVAASVPNVDTTLTWQTHAVHKLDLSFTNDPEIVQFNQTGGTGGQINLTVVTRVLGKPPTAQFAVISFNASISEFIAAIKKLSNFSPYTINGVREMYDVNGILTFDPALANSYIWTVTINQVRTTAQINSAITPVFVGYTGTQKFTQTIIHPHGPLITGTFEMSINGNALSSGGTTALKSSISANDLQNAFRSITGFENTQVYILSNANLQAYGANWVILYYGINSPLPDLVINYAGLLGGKTGTNPMMVARTLRSYSSNLLFDPIDYSFLHTVSDKPNVIVTVNGMPSVCLNDCGYTFLSNTPTVPSASLSGSVVTLSLTDPASLGFTLDAVTITIAGQPCTIINPGASSIGNFQCQLPVNSDSTPTIPAGNYLPQISVQGVGMAYCLPAVNPFSFPFSLTSLNITTGGTNGGYDLLLKGTGFPTNMEDVTVNICGVKATLLSVSNIEAEVIVPECAAGDQDITISSKTETSSPLVFKYVVPPPNGFIYSVVPQSYNPALKGIMNITGIGFGTDEKAIRVDLANASGKVYPMRILSLNDTNIKVGIPGGLAGKYKVQVNIIGVGQILPNASTVNDFTYELVITSVTPSTGSFYGGTLINIAGINFSPALDETLVFIGNEINWFCNVQQLNTTNILCRTPQASQYYNISLPQTVYLQNRLIADNTCSGSCVFNYMTQSLSPSLTSMSVNTIISGSVTLTGLNIGSGSPKVVLTNKDTGVVTLVTPTSFNSTSVGFTVPNVESGSYNVKVRIDPIGETNGLLLTIQASITGVSPSSLSTNGGKVTISGRGLPSAWPNSNFVLKIMSNGKFIQPVVLGASSTALTLSLPSISNSFIFAISITPPVGSVLTASVTGLATATPILTLTSASLTTPGSNNFIFTKPNLATVNPSYVEAYSLFGNGQIYNVSIPTQTISGTFTFACVLPGGLFGFRFYYTQYGFATCTDTVTITISQPTIPSLVSSYNGGSFAITGTGLSPSAVVNINGFKTTLANITSSSAVATIPPFVSSLTQNQYQFDSPKTVAKNQYTIISDTAISNQNVFDGLQGTVYTSSSSSTCFIGIDLGSELVLNLTRVRFFPNVQWLIVAPYLVGSTIEASNDGVQYDVIGTVSSSVHSGWNIITFSMTSYYRYFRFSSDSVSKCQLAELEFQGVVLSNKNLASLTSNFADIVYQDGANTFTYSSKVQFREDHTPIVNSLSETTGHVFGNYSLTLTGNYLNFATPSITIDGQVCTIVSSTSASLVCNVSSRFTLPEKNTFIVKVGQNNAIVYESFSYVMRWSDIRTWGTDMPPIDGDLVYVPRGMNLLVDQSTPILEGILVENGTITFADESDMTVQAGFITIVGGQFLAGTENSPYQHQLTFIMHGNYYGAQAPMFGNKGIGCMECRFSMHGQVRSVTWTSLETTAASGTNTITVQDAVDWRVGEQIVVASTNFDHNEAERRTITAISGKTITLNDPFKFSHFAGVESYGASGSDKLEMRAEVGLLTRNIKMTGDSDSVENNYGSHLLLTGSAENGLVGHVAYTEFFNCGQPRIIGRYCIHFHMAGDMSNSFVRGNAVHDSMARVVTLHGVHFLTVEYNVGYRVHGHNFFVEDGIETNNLIQYNLAIGSLTTFLMLQTDISVASFWITHPSNHLRYNHAAGSDFYGVWYELKPHPDGPSASGDVCPMGNALGQSHHNVAHSNIRFGLRIFKLTPRKYPCSQIYIEDEIDPWQNNPAIISTFSDYILYKNGECGLLAEQTGNVVYTRIVSAENKRAGVQFYISEFTPEPITLNDSFLVGQTQTNSPQSVSGSKGVITPREGNIRIDNIRFYNYPANTHSLETCSHCDNALQFTNTAQQIYISNITYTNVTGYKLFMNGLKRQILYDLDGSFTTTEFDGTQRASAAITTSYKHLLSEPACKPTTDVLKWDNTLACDQTVKVARVTFRKALPVSLFSMVGLKAEEISDVTAVVNEASTSFTEIYSFFSLANKKDSMVLPKTYALPYIAGRIYNIWWLTGLDFDGLTMSSSRYLKASDPAILFKFNYTLHREMFDIGPVRPHYPLTETRLFAPEATILDETSCGNGHYYQNDSVGNRTLEICASGINRTYFETTQISAIYCRYLCPAPPSEFIKQDFVRYWSNATQWPGERMPLPGENVTVNGNWTIIMDVDPAPCQFMQIDGDVIIEDKADRNITCNSIWIRAGSLKAGSSSDPFTHQITIQLNGLKNDPGYTFDPALQGSKIFVVTGQLSLYGSSPSTLYAKLTQSIFPGDTQLTVESVSGWSIGDTLVISPSFSSSNEYQRVQITNITGNTVTFSPALSFIHYGAPAITISNSYGSLDTRASVGHVTRNIKFVSGPDSGWGYTIVIYQMWEGKNSRTGFAVLDSVEFTLGGQYDTEKASLNLINNGDYSSGVTKIQKSSFSFCRSFCIYAMANSGANINHNIFYEGRKFHMKLNQISDSTIDSNLMIGAIFRPTMIGAEPVACIELTNTNPGSSSILVTNNLCQGSNLNGFVFPFVACSNLEGTMPFANNTAGSAQGNGFLLDRDVVTDTCLGFSGVRAYACTVGQIASPPGTSSLQYSDYIMADNKLGLSLRFGLAGTDRTATLSDSYFTAISRPNCSQCYNAGKTSCTWSQAIRLLVVTVNGERYPTAFGPGFDGLCKEEVLDSKAFLHNVAFENYKRSYSEAALGSCSNNILFRANSNAPDLIGSAYLWDSSCTNCDFDSMGYFDSPKTSELTWFGGCGDMLCTGRNNYIIEDHTGTLFPQGGVILANNSWIGQNTEGCTFSSAMNGYYCTSHQFAVLEYQSIAPDYNTRIMWPVSLKFDGGNWTSKTNGYKQWAWSGREPLNKRLGRFISTVRMFKYYNMSFASNPPDDMRLQLQKRTAGGNNSDWIVARIYYPFPNMIEVQANGVTIKPISLLNDNGEDPLNLTQCGSNKFFYYNRTIEFVVTGASDCMVRVSLTNSVQLTLHFAMNINDFYQTNGTTRLVDRICALFGIVDQSRVKIVSIYTGSTNVTVMISDTLAPESESTTANLSAGVSSIKILKAAIDASLTSGTLASDLQTKDGLGVLLSAETTLIPAYPESSNSNGDESNTKAILIGVFVSIGVAAIVTIVVVVWLKKKSNKVDSDLPASSQESESHGVNKRETIAVEHITEQNISDVVFEK